MPIVNIIRESEIIRTPRVKQLEGIFDVPVNEKTVEKFAVRIPIEERPWNIGLVVGPSGCGKTTIAHELWDKNLFNDFEWDEKKSILDSFPKEIGIKEITQILNSVGFSSPPSWLKPYKVLSNGEKFRVKMARALCESRDIFVVDEYTSVVDRTVAKIGSYAAAKTVRKMNKKFVAITCHYDIIEWLQPDWVYYPHTKDFVWRLLQCRPEFNVEIKRVNISAWKIFKKYHYLTSNIHKSAKCFCAFHESLPIVFFSFLHFPHPKLKKTKRAHRIVCLPDYQGLGIALRVEEFSAAMIRSLGFSYILTTSHPVRISQCTKSKLWKTISKPHVSWNRVSSKFNKRINQHIGKIKASFKYIGPIGDKKLAIDMGYN